MGFFSWVVAIGRKKEVVARIQDYFELSKHRGIFLGNPAYTAKRITCLAFKRIPGLAGKTRGWVLAASILTVALEENDLSLELRDHCAIALAAMLKAANTQRHLHTSEDRLALAIAQDACTSFRKTRPFLPVATPV